MTTMGPRPKPTIKDIARLSEASPSTVSAVLTGSWRDRRISPGTAERILGIAGREGYSANMQARGLRRGRSGMVGLIVPVHDNRFFAAMSQRFDAEARARGWCPVIVSTLRDPAEERRTAETLIAYAIDSLVIAGATDPAGVGAVCRAAGVPHVFIDLPGPDAPSVVSDNFAGAALLTRTILDRMPAVADPRRARPHFVGGVATDFASGRRIEGFRAEVVARLGSLAPEQIIACGYAPARVQDEIARLCDRLGGLPAALFVNSLGPFEGALAHFVTMPAEAFAETAIGVYDYDPIAAFLQFPVHMVRQNSDAMVARALDIVAAGGGRGGLIEVLPDLVPPRTIRSRRPEDLG